MQQLNSSAIEFFFWERILAMCERLNEEDSERFVSYENVFIIDQLATEWKSMLRARTDRFSLTICVWYYIGILLKALDAIGAEGQGRRFVTRGGGAGSRSRQVRHAAVVVRVLVLLRSWSIAQLDGHHDHEDHQEQPRCGSHHGAQQWTRQRQHNWRQSCKLYAIVSRRLRRKERKQQAENNRDCVYSPKINLPAVFFICIR